MRTIGRLVIRAARSKMPWGVFASLAGMLITNTAAEGEFVSRGAFDPHRNAYIWAQYLDGDDWAQATQFVRLGGTKYFVDGDWSFLAIGQGLITRDGDHGGASAGFVTRRMLGAAVVGAGLHWDYSESTYGNDFHQLVGSFEHLLDKWRTRVNIFAPIGDRIHYVGAANPGPSGVTFQGNNLVSILAGFRQDETSLDGVEFDLARAICDVEAEAFIGYYHYDGSLGRSADGIKGGLRGWVTPNLTANVEIREDRIFDTSVFGGLTFYFGKRGGVMPRDQRGWLTAPVIRRHQVAVNKVQRGAGAGSVTLLTSGGNPITVTHVTDSGGAGAGTYENPHGSLSDANGSGSDIVYVYSNTSFNNQTYAAAAGQRVLGEGGNNQHLVVTDQLGTINLPAANGVGQAPPTLSNAAAPAALDGADGVEFSNFLITGAAVGVRANGLAGSMNVNRTQISGGTTGIDIVGGSGTFTFTDVTVTNPAASALSVTGGSANINFGGANNPSAGLFGASQIVQGAAGSAVSVSGSHIGALVLDAASTINATNGDGLQFDNADGTYNFAGQVVLNGGDAGIDIITFSDGTFTFADTTITNPSGTALGISSGDVNLTFNGSISQANNAAAISIVGHTMGTVTFQNGTIAATGGTGLQFLNADGTYIFSDQVTLNGADAGIDLLFDSDGTFSFANADITSPTGTAINIDGGSSDVTFSAGSSVVQNNNATTIQVDGGHDGSLAMSVGSTIDATNGNGIQFNDADGVYNMNSATTLAGGDAGIDIVGGSGGTFGFVGAQQITNSTGVAVNIDGGGGQAAQVTFTGLDIDQSVGSGVIANNSGSLTISFSSIDNASGDGINATNTDLTTIVTTIGLNGVNTRGIQFASDSGDQLTLNNTDVSMNGAAGSIGIRVENTSAVTALGLSGNGNTSLNATTATQSVDAGGGFTGTINVNGGADNLP